MPINLNEFWISIVDSSIGTIESNQTIKQQTGKYRMNPVN